MAECSFAERLSSVRERMERAAKKSGRTIGDVKLIAVSKFHPVEAIREAFLCGQTAFGENYVQEVKSKQAILADCPTIEWHFIGHIQLNKAKDVAGKFTLIHSLDDARLAKALSDRLPENTVQNILIQVNLGNEQQKSGVSFDELCPLLEQTAKFPKIRILGLMGMPPVFDAGEAARPFFARLRQCRDDAERRLGMHLPELSMGMSGDFEPAIEEGATMVRIGTTLFGSRPIIH